MGAELASSSSAEVGVGAACAGAIVLLDNAEGRPARRRNDRGIYRARNRTMPGRLSSRPPLGHSRISF